MSVPCRPRWNLGKQVAGPAQAVELVQAFVSYGETATEEVQAVLPRLNVTVAVRRGTLDVPPDVHL